MGDTWIVDITHYLLPDGLLVPGPAGRIAAYFGSIVSAATTQPSGTWRDMAVQCRRRPGRKPCPGHIRIRRLDVPLRIEWHCSSCDDNGTIEGWRGTLWDRSQLAVPAPSAEIIPIRVTAAELRELRTVSFDLESQAIVDGATIDSTGILLRGTADDFDNFIGFIASEANHATDRRRQQQTLDQIIDRIEAALTGS